MAWEWIAPAATGAAAIAGIGATYFTGREARKHAEQVAQQAAANAAQMAYEARKQERFNQAYRPLLKITGDFARWTAEIRPIFDTGERQTASPPDPKDQDEMWRLVAMYGSEPVRNKYADFRAAMIEVIHADADLSIADETMRNFGEPGIDRAAISKKLHNELKPTVQRIRQELEQLVATDLDQHPAPSVTEQSPSRRFKIRRCSGRETSTRRHQG